MKHPRCQFLRFAALACAVTVVPDLMQTRAQTGRATVVQEDEMRDVTVLTIAPDGGWGAATEQFIYLAIANAVARCKVMSGAKLGCGAHFSSIRAGWTLGLRCGHKTIIVADHDRAEARRLALQQEALLRTEYAPDMPKCIDVVTIDPDGRIMPAPPQIENTVDATRSR